MMKRGCFMTKRERVFYDEEGGYVYGEEGGGVFR